ncbi:HD domain-containing protein [Clostridium baratii]|uniref:HD domain-containing protein n=1 Tax=Clostridium baratii TaxID=1561 RepID=UPI003D7BAD51
MNTNIKNILNKINDESFQKKFNLNSYRIYHMKYVADLCKYFCEIFDIPEDTTDIIIIAALIHDTYKKIDGDNHSKLISDRYEEVFHNELNLTESEKKLLKDLLLYHTYKDTLIYEGEYKKEVMILGISDNTSKKSRFFEKFKNFNYCDNPDIIKKKICKKKRILKKSFK